MRKPKLTTFRVQAIIKSVVEVEVAAKTLEEAVLASKSLSASDFVEILGDEADHTFKISGVFSDNWDIDE